MILYINPHKAFNVYKGCFHKQGLYEFSEEILVMLQDNVQYVYKVRGKNIMLIYTFCGLKRPEYIKNDPLHLVLQLSVRWNSFASTVKMFTH